MTHSAVIIFLLTALGLYQIQDWRARVNRGFAQQMEEVLTNEVNLGIADSQEIRMNRAVYIYHRAVERKLDLDAVFGVAFAKLNYRPSYERALRRAVEENHRLAIDYGFLTEENLALMEQGINPVVSAGAFQGNEGEFASLIPGNYAPEIAADFSNIRYVGDQREIRFGINENAIQLAEQLYTALVMTDNSYRRVLDSQTPLLNRS